MALENVKRAKELVSGCSDEIGSSLIQEFNFKLQEVKVDVSDNLSLLKFGFQPNIEDKWIFCMQGSYLSMLCYNFGVKCFQEKKFEQCVEWLRESFDLSKIGGCSRENQVVESMWVVSDGRMHTHAWVFLRWIRLQ